MNSRKGGLCVEMVNNNNAIECSRILIAIGYDILYTLSGYYLC